MSVPMYLISTPVDGDFSNKEADTKNYLSIDGIDPLTFDNAFDAMVVAGELKLDHYWLYNAELNVYDEFVVPPVEVRNE